jgi:hypothetical protein
MSLMSNAAPKVTIMAASRCCVYLLQSCMDKIMYSTHSTPHFLKQRCTKCRIDKYIYVFNLKEKE